MIINHIGILIYPGKESAEMGIVFSKYSFFFFFFNLILFYVESQINWEKKNQ